MPFLLICFVVGNIFEIYFAPVFAAWSRLNYTNRIKRHVLEKAFSERVDGIRGAQVRWEDELSAK